MRRRHGATLWLSLLGLAALCAAPRPAAADPIPGLYTTGVDNSNNVLGLGVPDPHYIVLDGAIPGASAITLSSLPGSYIPNDATSLWVWENADGQPTNVTRTFRTTFDLTGFDPSTATISGLWAMDNFGLDILINGTSTGQSVLGNGGFNFGSYSPFTTTSGFAPGINTLDFVIQDAGGISGFRVGSISGTATPGTTAVPGPSTLALTGLGMLGIFGWARRRKKSS